MRNFPAFECMSAISQLNSAVPINRMPKAMYLIATISSLALYHARKNQPARACRRIDDYPHQLSGGMRQRVMIAMALINSPDLLIADEPTTALDVTVQAQILELIKDLQSEFHTAVVIITHDLGVVAEVADEVVVMYGGQVVEHGDVDPIYAQPQMPYTLGLLASVPRMDLPAGERLAPIPGAPPSLIDLPPGCIFRPRCTYHQLVPDGRCIKERPTLDPTSDSSHLVRCFLTEAQRTSAAVDRLGRGADEVTP
jgi:peptide/nickel transport system ATP-binding protein